MFILLLLYLTNQACILCLFWLWQYAMEVIVDELRKNNVDVDVQIFTVAHNCHGKIKLFTAK